MGGIAPNVAIQLGSLLGSADSGAGSDLVSSSVIWLLSTAFPLTVSLSMADHNAIVGKLDSIESLVQEIAIHVEVNHADQ